MARVISDEDRLALVGLARGALEASVLGKALSSVASPASATGILAERRGCFVTLTNQGRLRGCIGTFSPQKPLGELVVDMARQASCDSRFVMDPITPAELEQIHVEVSVLSPLERTEHPEELELGRDGIYIVAGGRAGCFLPEVATEAGWSVEEFLDACCTHKAGLPAGAWRESTTAVYLFTSEKFGE